MRRIRMRPLRGRCRPVLPAGLLMGLLIGLLLPLGGPAAAQQTDGRAAIVQGFCAAKTEPMTGALDTLLTAVAQGREDAAWGARIVAALAGKDLRCRPSGPAFLQDGDTLLDPVTMAAVASPEALPGAPFVNLRTRAWVETATALLGLMVAPDGPEADGRIAVLEKQYAVVPDAALAAAIERQEATDRRERLQLVQALKSLEAPDAATRVQAIAAIATMPTERNRTALVTLRGTPGYADDPAVAAALDAAIGTIDTWIGVGRAGAVLFSGLSYASILFMAALGLAVIFGLMGVINLAQGELIMIGAYATYGIQQALRAVAPGLLDWYLVLAIPAAFAASALVGMVMETVVIRHLYRRPLMTLLATWAISLFLVNLVQVLFGTQNLEFVVPSFLAGGTRLVADFIVTWNRLFAIVFAAGTLVLALLLLHRTPLGTYVRAVTENRDMAECVGVSTRRVDLLSFGVGSGLAGLAGLALTPIYNVNPTMGANFIVDAFLVVVLGGVGNLAGTLIAALGIGQVNIVIEPLWGAVAAKVMVLLMIILFIQFRPEGIFAVKGRR